MSADIHFFIDQVAVVAKDGETILDVAAREGVYIPSLCYHRKVSHTTSCFVCVVQDEKSGQFIPSCAAKPSEGQRVLSDVDVVADMRKSALELLLSDHQGDCEAPCTLACPAHAKVEEYVRAGKNGEFLEALKIIKERIPFPVSVSRVCPRFCEQDCRRNIDDEPVAINEFKRMASDLYYDSYVEECEALNGHRVAIVGAGPAGLSAAYFLRRNGVASTVYEAMPEPGGMQMWGIPEFRLPKALLKKEIAHLDKLGGIDIECNKALGAEIEMTELKANYDAVVLAIGSWKAASMRCEGEELAQNGIDWLRKVALDGFRGENPGRVVVVGGGNTAVDCTRTAVRLGADAVTCLYRRTEAEMPAEDYEVREAREEGVKFSLLAAPVAIARGEDALQVTCIRMELGEPDASGRRRPVPIDGSEFTIVADTIIAAIGQKTDAPEGIPVNRWGDVDVARGPLSVEDNVFAAGDCVTGPASVVEALAAGRRAALSVIESIANKPFSITPDFNVSLGHWRFMSIDDVVPLKERSANKRLALAHPDIETRKNSFTEVTISPAPDDVQREGDRCYECSCTSRDKCALKQHSEACGASPSAIKGMQSENRKDLRHPTIIFDGAKCIKCGICIKICSEVVNADILDFKKRGFSTEVGTGFHRPFPDSCGDCMQCVDACPVGALDRKLK